jgi:hypothetical protein
MGTDWYLVFAGRVDVIVDDVLVKTLGKFAWFGEGAALSGNKLRNASCVAASKVTVLQVRTLSRLTLERSWWAHTERGGAGLQTTRDATSECLSLVLFSAGIRLA